MEGGGEGGGEGIGEGIGGDLLVLRENRAGIRGECGKLALANGKGIKRIL